MGWVKSPTGERKWLLEMGAVVRENVGVGNGGCRQSERGCWRLNGSQRDVSDAGNLIESGKNKIHRLLE